MQTHGRCATCMVAVAPFTKKSTRGHSFAAECSVPESVAPDALGSSRLVHLTDYFVVSVPYSSSSQYSMMVVPRRHYADFLEITPEELADLSSVLALLAQAIYTGLDDPSYNIFIRSAPSTTPLRIQGRDVFKEEIDLAFHWILEFRPRFPADLGGFEIASGVRVVTGLPEDHAAELRGWVRARIDAGMPPVEAHPVPHKLRASTKQSRYSRQSKSSSHRRPTKQAWSEPSKSEPLLPDTKPTPAPS